MKSMKKCS